MRLLFTLFVCYLFLHSCIAPSVYVPQTINVPTFTDGNQLRASGYVGGDHVEMLGAYSLKKYGFMLNQYVGTFESAKTYMGEADLGIYGVYNGKKPFGWDCFAGGGYGSRNYYDPADISGHLIHTMQQGYRINAGYGKVFLQGSLYTWDKKASGAFTIKYDRLFYNKSDLAYVRYQYDYNLYSYVRTDTQHVSSVSFHADVLSFALTLTAGKIVRGIFQPVMSVPLQKFSDKEINNIPFFPGNFSFNIGLAISLGKSLKKESGK